MLEFQPAAYRAQLREKRARLADLLTPFDAPAIESHASPASAYRARAEFRIWHDGDDLYYAMFDRREPKTPRRVDHFPIALERIQHAMPALLTMLRASPALRRKLFQVEFLATLSGELLVTLIYHRPLDESWDAAARAVEASLEAHVIGRSRKQKRVLSRDFVEERLPLAQGDFRYRQPEGGFTQPNPRVNCSMIDWACRHAGGAGGDLLELYCGNGNFTFPLAAHFDRVLATEVAKTSIRAALENRQLNGGDNVAIARLSAEDVSRALAGERVFKRLAALATPLADYRFSTVLVDPPRAGLDAATRDLVGRFEKILYISCNPETLARDLTSLAKRYRLEAAALFDQFPYTRHIECGALLVRRQQTVP